MAFEQVTNRLCGHAAEHLVCFDLAKRGVWAVNNPIEGAPYDIVADYNGFLIRIQVKSTLSPKQDNSYRTLVCSGETKKYPNRPKYRFHVKQSQLQTVELIAFVAVDLGTIVYKSSEDINETTTEIRIKTDVMQNGCDLAISRFLSDLNNLSGL